MLNWITYQEAKKIVEIIHPSDKLIIKIPCRNDHPIKIPFPTKQRIRGHVKNAQYK